MIQFIKWLWTQYQAHSKIKVQEPVVIIPIDWKKKYVFIYPELLPQNVQDKVMSDIESAMKEKRNMLLTGQWQLVPKENVIQ